jgi:hypothetical protein
LRRTGLTRLARAAKHSALPLELRRWAGRQLKLAATKRNGFAVAYAVLVLRDALQWELDQQELDAVEVAAFEDSALAQEQAAWVVRNGLACGSPMFYGTAA